MWESIAEIQVFREEFHTHIHLDYISVEFLSCIQKKKKKKKKKKKRKKKRGKKRESPRESIALVHKVNTPIAPTEKVNTLISHHKLIN